MANKFWEKPSSEEFTAKEISVKREVAQLEGEDARVYEKCQYIQLNIHSPKKKTFILPDTTDSKFVNKKQSCTMVLRTVPALQYAS